MNPIRLAAVALAFALGAPLAPASAAPLFQPATATDLGTGKLYAETDAEALLAGIAVSLAGGTDRQPIAKSGVAALLAETIVRTKVDGLPAREAIEAGGGSLTYFVAGPYVRYYVEARAERLPAAVAILGRALASPDYSNATVASARTWLNMRIDQEERNPVGVGVRMLSHSYYTGAAGLPPLGTPANLAGLNADDVRAFHDSAYRAGSTVLTGAGRVGPPVADAARALLAGLPQGTAPDADVKTSALGTTPKRIVTHRDVGVPFVLVGFAAPSAGDRDFAPFLVVASLLESAFSRTSATTLPVLQRPVGTVYVPESHHASFDVYINGGQTDPTLGLRELSAVMRALATRPLPSAAVARYRTIALGAYLTESQSLAERAARLSSYVQLGLDPDYANTVANAIENVSASDVQRVAKTYLRRYSVAVVFPRERLELSTGS